MERIQVKDKRFKKYLTEDSIKNKVQEVAHQINHDLSDSKPLFLVVLNGSFVFAADLLRQVNLPCDISFIKVSSYEGTNSTGNVKQVIGLKEDLEGRDVVVIEDIIDSGLTMCELLSILEKKHPRTIKVASLLVKPNNLKVDLKIDYRCFEIPNDFIVGYGLDYDGEGRNLPDIYSVID